MACVLSAGVRGAPPVPAGIGQLAEHVPVDAQLFLEVRDAAGLSRTPAGAALGDVLAWLMAEVKTGKEPMSPQGRGWRQLFLSALGLQNDEVADVLLNGRLAIAVAGWSELASAILVAEPADATRIEAVLKSYGVSASGSARVRQYRLSAELECASDGRVVVVGRHRSPTDLYGRAVGLLGADRGVCLGDLAEFRERMAEVLPGAQAVLYLGTNLRRPAGAGVRVGGGWLPGPPLRSGAVALQLAAQKLVVEMTGRLAAPAPGPSHEPPVDALVMLPASAVAAWTYSVDYVGELRRLRASHGGGVVPFYLGLLQWQMEPDALEKGLLRHLVGDTVFMVGRVGVRPGAACDGRAVLVPTFSLFVETTDPETVEATLEELAGNLLRLVNLQAESGNPAAVHAEVLGGFDGGTLIRSIPLGSLFPAGAFRELLGTMELSWAVADGRLVLGTHRETVRQIVLAQRGEAPLMPADAIQQALRRGGSAQRPPEMILVAQPGDASEVIDSLLGYMARNHPEMEQAQWWRRLRRQHAASQVQLGILPAAGAAAGLVEVADTLPGWPAERRLVAGDLVRAVDGRSLDPERTLQSLREALAARVHEDRVRLGVVRRGREIEVEIPMPVGDSAVDHLHPLAVLRRISDLSRMFSFASYVTWRPSRDVVQTRLELRLAGAVQPAVPGRADAAQASPVQGAGGSPFFGAGRVNRNVVTAEPVVVPGAPAGDGSTSGEDTSK